MSVTLITGICATVTGLTVLTYGKIMLDKSKVECITETYDEKPVEYSIQAETIGLGIQIVGYGFDRVDEMTDKVINSSFLYRIFDRLGIESEGEYFHFGSNREWSGYGDDVPIVKPGKYDIRA